MILNELKARRGILHPAFKLFFSGGFQYFSQSIAKINNPYFLSLGWSDAVSYTHLVLYKYKIKRNHVMYNEKV